MKQTHNFSAKQTANRLKAVLICLILVLPNIAHAECNTGAVSLANVYVRMNPIIAYYFGSIEDYVQHNRSHFVNGGDATVCAERMSQALLHGAIQSHDPQLQRRRDALNARLGAMGLSPGQPHASPSQQMFAMARKLNKLAYALPYAANGNYGPLWTPRDQMEEMIIFANRMFHALLQDPAIRSSLSTVEPMIRDLANIEYRIILNIASQL